MVRKSARKTTAAVSADPADDDVIIDLGERLAPYGDTDPRPEWRDGFIAADARRAQRSLRMKSPAPRHMAK